METVKPLSNINLHTPKKFGVSDFQKFWKEIVAHKYLFITSLILCLGGAYLLNKTSNPVYLVESSMIIREMQNPSNNPGSMLFSKEGQVAPGNPVNKLEEIAVLQSYPFIFNTLRKVDFQISYYKKGFYRTDELWGKVPFQLQILDTSLLKNLSGKRFAIRFSGKNEFTVQNKAKEDASDSTFQVGKTFNLEKVPVQILINEGYTEKNYLERDFEFLVKDLNTLTFEYKGNISVYSPDEESPVLQISLKTPNPEKGKAFLNALTNQYIVSKYEEKSRSASQALAFINEQISSVRGSLGSAESNLASFRANNTFTDAQEMANRNLNVISQLEEERATLSLNDRYYSKVLNDLTANSNLEELISPSSVGVQDNLTESLIKQLAELQLEKNSYAANGGNKNPLIQEIDVKIRNVKASLRDNIRSLSAANRTKLNQVNARSNQIQAKVYSIPIAEKRFTDIKRTTDFNDALYQFLMQKRVEAGILKASATVEDKIIEPAFLPLSVPVSPKTTNNYALGLLIGLVLPMGIIRLKKSLNKRVTDKAEIIQHTSMPIVGSIYHNQKAEVFVINANARTAVSESFRMLRSNLAMHFKSSTDKVLLISSLDSGEGKSFISTNLGFTYAVAKKKTILINLDLRVPSSAYGQLGKYDKGISEFLDNKAALNDIIVKTDNPFLDVIHTGTLPENPAEMLMDNKLEFLLEFLKSQYDIIIIDTPPLGLVADPLIVAKYASLSLIVTREKHTIRQRLDELEELYNSGKLKDACMVINDVHLDRKGYQNAYYYSK